jgi:hypothetical protein
MNFYDLSNSLIIGISKISPLAWFKLCETISFVGEWVLDPTQQRGEYIKDLFLGASRNHANILMMQLIHLNCFALKMKPLCLIQRDSILRLRSTIYRPNITMAFYTSTSSEIKRQEVIYDLIKMQYWKICNEIIIIEDLIINSGHGMHLKRRAWRDFL